VIADHDPPRSTREARHPDAIADRAALRSLRPPHAGVPGLTAASAR